MPNDFNIPPVSVPSLTTPVASDINAQRFIPQPSLQFIAPYLFRIPSEPSDAAEFTSYLGTPIYSNLIFDAIKNSSPQNTLGDQPTGNQPDGSLRIDTVLFIVNQQKNIVKHVIPGRKNGTIKTYISMGDYEIQIMGAIVSQYANVFPKDDVRALIKFCELPQSLKVTSQFLSHFEVSTIVVENYNIAEKMGSRNEVPFTIFASSDMNADIDNTGVNWQIR